MKIDNKFKNIINNSVVRIVAESIDINWKIPYLLNEPKSGQGTGFFINESCIVTCAHVVDHAINLYIEIPEIDSTKYECTILSICPEFDIALIKTKKYKSKYHLSFGNSDNLNLGENVFVVGYPVSISSSRSSSNNLKYTVGIISGQQNGYIQTDSAINPGNSGGPLFLKNKVVGINSLKLSGNKLDLIGYAVPINNFKVIEKDCYNNIIVYRPNLLFEYNNNEKNLLKELTNGKINNGIMISKIYDGSILKEQNIKHNSIITRINGENIDNYGFGHKKWIGSNIDTSIILNKFENNSTVIIKYYDNELKKIIKKNIKLTPVKLPIRNIYSNFEKVDYFILGGIIFMNLTKNHIMNLIENKESANCIINKKEDLLKEKVIISFIFPNTIAKILNNIKENDIIIKINDKKINSLNDIYKYIKIPVVINNIEYIKIEEQNSKFIIIKLEDIIKKDIIYSKIYKYKLSNFHELYMKKYNIKNNIDNK